MWYRLVFIQLILKVYIYLPWINTQQRATAPFYRTSIISSRDHQKIGLYQGSSYHCEGDHNSDLICLLQKYLAIHYSNQSVLAIVLDLNIFVLCTRVVNLVTRSALIQLSLLCALYLYNLTGIKVYIFCL